MVQAGRHFLIGFLFFNVLSCVAPRIARGEDPKAPILPLAVERRLAWFPKDTETVVAAQSFQIPSLKEGDAAEHNLKPGGPDFDRWIRLFALEGLPELNGGSIWRRWLEAKSSWHCAALETLIL
jgi:hypothetical protein